MGCNDCGGGILEQAWDRLSARQAVELLAYYEGRKLAFARRADRGERTRLRSNNVLMPTVDFGGTKIGEVYGRNGLALTAYIRGKPPRVYVSEDECDRMDALRKLGATVVGDGWLMPRTRVVAEVRPLAELDMETTIDEGDGGVLKGWICVAFAGGVCVNLFRTDTQQFTCSIKTPSEGMNVCRPYPGETCAYKWSTGQVMVYAAADCLGPGAMQNRTLATCQPA